MMTSNDDSCTAFAFRQRCRPVGAFRSDDAFAFMELTRRFLPFDQLFDMENGVVPFTKSDVFQVLDSTWKHERNESFGIVEQFSTGRRFDETKFTFQFHLGASRLAAKLDLFNIISLTPGKVPGAEFVRQSVRLIKPFEAFIAENKSEAALNSFDRQRLHASGFSRPAIIRWIHYLDREMADAIGGVKKCLKAPAWRVEKLLTGVLIQLTEEQFIFDREDHRAVQLEVMEYFGMPRENPPEEKWVP